MPAPPPPPPAPTFNLGGGSAEDGRGALLQSIRGGKALRKTVTVDKSAPVISGKVRGESTTGSNSPSPSAKAPSANNSVNNGSSPMGLGGLFAGGMPKLKPTGMRNNLAERDNGNGPVSSSATLPSVKRGPPPVPPPAAQKPQIFSPSAQQSPELGGSNHNPEAPSRNSFGKPTLAPKPPGTTSSKPSPPPKKLSLATGNSVSRAQSMRVARSPPVLAPTPPSLHQSQDCLNEPQQRPNRVLRAPGVRPPSPPVSRLQASNGGPATPITRVAPPPPCRAPSMPPPPPPLPHRSSSSASMAAAAAAAATSSSSRLAPPVPPPPTPPTRGQSLHHHHQQQRSNGQPSPGPAEFEARFADMFHSIAVFPSPEPYRGLTKVYNSKTAAKQQAPAPPLRSVSNAGSALHSRQAQQQQQQQQAQQAQQQQWQQQQNAAC